MASFDRAHRNTYCRKAIRAAASVVGRLLFAACLGVGIAPIAAAADSGPLIETMNVGSVRIEVIWIETQAEMDRRRREYGTRVATDSVVKTALRGFSVLGKRDGEFVCLIFSTKPARFDDSVNTTLGHELLHCLGFSHR